MSRSNNSRRALFVLTLALAWMAFPAASEAHTHRSPTPVAPASEQPKRVETATPAEQAVLAPRSTEDASDVEAGHGAPEWTWAISTILLASGAGLFVTRRFSIRLAIGCLLIASATIHLLLAPAHWQEGWHLGVFFVGSSLALFALAISITSARRQVPWVGLGILTTLIGLYFISRMVVLPGVGHAENFDAAGLITKSAEALAVAGYVVLLRRPVKATGVPKLVRVTQP